MYTCKYLCIAAAESLEQNQTFTRISYSQWLTVKVLRMYSTQKALGQYEQGWTSLFSL